MGTEGLNDVWLVGTTWWQGCGELLLQDNCFCKTTASARLWLYLKRLYFISSAIAYCISPYASFYAGLSCCLLKLFEFGRIVTGNLWKQFGFYSTAELIYEQYLVTIWQNNYFLGIIWILVDWIVTLWTLFCYFFQTSDVVKYSAYL